MTRAKGSSPARKSFSKALTAEMQEAVSAYKDQVYEKILGTQDLYSLILRWSDGKPLTVAQKATVRSKLRGICQEIPRLAALLVPYGSILLATLLKAMPFNIIPSMVISTRIRTADHI